MSREISLGKTHYSFAFDCAHCGTHHHRPDVVCSCGALLVNGLNPGAVIAGRYRSIATIGNGGMGLIVKAYDPREDCEVALKMLLRNNNAGEVTRFMQECKATAILSHPCIITAKEYGVTDDGYPFMAMEYLTGEDLKTHISRHGALDPSEALEIFQQLCDTMAYAHKKGVVHRDLKPSNIMLAHLEGDKPKIKIVDFGIAKVVYTDGVSTQADLTRTGQIIGSPLYMSPEQALGKKIDFRTDIYSAGCVLYHALTGAPPIVGESSIETLFKHVNEVPPSMSEASLGKKFPPALEDLVAKALKKDPAQRYQSFEEMKEDLVAVLNRGTIISTNSNERSIGDRTSQKRSSFAILAVAGTAVCTIVAVCCLWSFRQNHQDAVKSINATPTIHDQPAAGKTEQTTELEDQSSVEREASDELVSGGLKPFIDFNVRTQCSRYDFSEKGVSDKIVDYLVRRVKETNAPIDSLKLNGSQITDQSMQLLAESHLPLKHLSVQHTKITAAGLKSISRITSLQKLELAHDLDIAPSGYNCLGNLKRLTMLNMYAAVTKPCTEKDFAFLAQLKMLESIDLGSCPALPSRVFKYAESLPRLKMVSCTFSGLNDKSLSDLGRINSLEELHIADRLYTDAGMKNLEGLTGLTLLQCGGRNLTKASFPSLIKLRNLTTLFFLNARQISAGDIDALRQQMPQCSISRS